MDSSSRWNPVTAPQLIGFACAAGVFFLAVALCEPGFVMVLDHANLLFHEAGHPFAGIFSQALEPYGGTMGQLTFPVVIAVVCWRKGQSLGFAAALIWFFENWLNISRYMADARKLQLPLVGGGDHDWNTILARWDILMYETRIAAALKTIAWIGIVLSCCWALWQGWRNRVPAQEFGARPHFPDVAR
jgi:hypothetical protein